MDNLKKNKKSIMSQNSFYIYESHVTITDHSSKQSCINSKTLPMDLTLQNKKISKYHRSILMIRMKIEEYICKMVIINLLATNSRRGTLVGCSSIYSCMVK